MFDGQCPFTVAWSQERFVADETLMMESNMPSYTCYHDYPHWLYQGIVHFKGLTARREERNASA